MTKSHYIFRFYGLQSTELDCGKSKTVNIMYLTLTRAQSRKLARTAAGREAIGLWLKQTNSLLRGKNCRAMLRATRLQFGVRFSLSAEQQQQQQQNNNEQHIRNSDLAFCLCIAQFILRASPVFGFLFSLAHVREASVRLAS